MTGVFEVPREYDPPFQRVLGIRMGVGEDGAGIAWVQVDPSVHYGTRWAHGGLAASLADIASGIAVGRKLGRDAEKIIDGTVELKINFLRKVVEADLTARATVLHLGKRVAVTDVVVTNGGTLCAKAIGTFMLARPPQETEPH